MNEKVKTWLIKAFEDYIAMRMLFQSEEKEFVTSVVCFHAQQFVEKLLKAFLIHHNVPFPKTHILEVLKQKCLEIDDTFQNLDFKNLSQYAVEIRYPDEFYLPTTEEADECLKLAENVKNFILSKLNTTQEEILKWLKEAEEK
uniref:HEPN domain-containing protein n=1 Tax=Thermodesulfobacterium geofontis TaxID=1295609 RepID=A0A7V5XFD0_9BACT